MNKLLLYQISQFNLSIALLIRKIDGSLILVHLFVILMIFTLKSKRLNTVII